jgi:hypothetical protein
MIGAEDGEAETQHEKARRQARNSQENNKEERLRWKFESV